MTSPRFERRPAQLGWLTANIVAVLLVGRFAIGQTQTPAAPKELTGTDVLRALMFIKSFTDPGLTPEYHIEGVRIFDQPLVADRLVLHPGSQIVFVGVPEAYVVARTIVVQPRKAGEAMPAISWGWPNETLPAPPPVVGRGAAGSLGGVEGASGGPGADGLAGTPGFRGRNAPKLYLLVAQVEGGQLAIDLPGGLGGPGGQGQAGGDGGPGRSGRNAVSSIFDCRSGGGDGGAGGRAGNGGDGGTGGTGGNGGSFVLLMTGEKLDALREAFVVNVGPGKGGKGGPGGPPGTPGPPGDGGSGSGFCRGGTPGAPGAAGSGSKEGARGADGVAGEFLPARLTPQQFAFALGG